jgi:hypothetical protein
MLRQRMEATLQEWVTPILAAEGFRKRKNVYERRFSEMAWVVDIQWGQFKNAVDADWTLNCGVFVEGVTSAYFDRPDPKQAQLLDCCIQTRVGMLSQGRTDKWWRLQSSDEAATVDQQIGEDVSSRIRADCLPFLKRFLTSNDVLDFLVAPRKKELQHVWPQSKAIAFSYAAAIASHLKNQREMEAFLQSAIEESKGSPIEDIVLRLQKKLNTEMR